MVRSLEKRNDRGYVYTAIPGKRTVMKKRTADFAFIKRSVIATLGVFVCLFASSCASLGTRIHEDDVLEAAELIAAGENEILASRSALPFLLDGEILMMKGDTRSLWKNLAESGFALKAPRVTSLEPAGEESYLLFDDSMEVKSWFAKYVPETGTIARIDGEKYSLLLVMNGSSEGAAVILGMRIEQHE